MADTPTTLAIQAIQDEARKPLLADIERMRAALREGAKCLEDVASGKGGWAWEEVIQSMDLAANGE